MEEGKSESKEMSWGPLLTILVSHNDLWIRIVTMTMERREWILDIMCNY